MTVDLSTIDQYDGKNVVMHLSNEDGSVREIEAKIEKASRVGVAYKEKGKRDVELAMPDDIVEIELAPEKDKKVTQKKLDSVKPHNMKQHLVDRHGLKRSEIDNLTEQTATSFHAGLDHSDLGHMHMTEEEKAAVAAKKAEKAAAKEAKQAEQAAA